MSAEQTMSESKLNETTNKIRIPLTIRSLQNVIKRKHLEESEGNRVMGDFCYDDSSKKLKETCEELSSSNLIRFQANVRGYLLRKKLKIFLLNVTENIQDAACIIQACCKSRILRKSYLRYLDNVILVERVLSKWLLNKKVRKLEKFNKIRALMSDLVENYLQEISRDSVIFKIEKWRRNSFIVDDTIVDIEDLQAILRGYLVRKHGKINILSSRKRYFIIKKDLKVNIFRKIFKIIISKIKNFSVSKSRKSFIKNKISKINQDKSEVNFACDESSTGDSRSSNLRYLMREKVKSVENSNNVGRYLEIWASLCIQSYWRMLQQRKMEKIKIQCVKIVQNATREMLQRNGVTEETKKNQTCNNGHL
ncbi:uncharacterized protein [Centruroides vittatus]|uniref:uncharacterized protein n=1 Tax=Centruroides vittatus TaxID=120091 RepID=UPI00350EDA85